MGKKKRKDAATAELDLLVEDKSSSHPGDDEHVDAVSPPAFEDLLNNKKSDADLPDRFTPGVEASHLKDLWERHNEFRKYDFLDFIFAGGSGMVFRVRRRGTTRDLALKVSRQRLSQIPEKEYGVAKSLSPVSEAELKALDVLSHPNIVRLYDAIQDTQGVFAVATSYIDEPINLDIFIKKRLKNPPTRRNVHPLALVSNRRLEDACRFILDRLTEIASALRHMHDQKIYHFDVKPANILVSGLSTSGQAYLTDMGSCVHWSDIPDGKLDQRVHFSWPYAHPDLRDLSRNPSDISGGGLSASADVPVNENPARFDLFALGKTLQEILGILEREFRERTNSSYMYRFLHLTSCLLLDGKGSSAHDQSRFQDGRYFVADVALDCPRELFQHHRIDSATALCERLERFTGKYSLSSLAPEFDRWQPEVINSSSESRAPFTPRLRAVFNHPCVRRLKLSNQLGWMREVYPGATHDRWSHTVGVLSSLVSAFEALLSDHEVPTFRLVADGKAIDNAMAAAIVHDLGQSTFGHDLEEACPGIFSHEAIINDLLDETFFGAGTLRNVFERYWPNVEFERVHEILSYHKPSHRAQSQGSNLDFVPIDGVAVDLLSGPTDVDKLDYLLRDSIACGVPYGLGIDAKRFLSSLTVAPIERSDDPFRLGLAYKAKGRAAIESLLLARYQMFSAVYWHHSFRCIQAMFVCAAAETFKGLGRLSDQKMSRTIRGVYVSVPLLEQLYYRRAVCQMPWEASIAKFKDRLKLEKEIEKIPPSVSAEAALEIVWVFASDENRLLLKELAERKLYRRIFELRVGDLGNWGNYEAIKSALSPEKRAPIAKKIQEDVIEAINNQMRKDTDSETLSKDEAIQILTNVEAKPMPLIVVDFPMRGVPNEENMPKEMGDPARKYFAIDDKKDAGSKGGAFHDMRLLHEKVASVRIFAEQGLHELVMRYLDSKAVSQCVRSSIPVLKKND